MAARCGSFYALLRSSFSLSLLFGAGCSSGDSPSLPRSIREKFSGATYQTHVVQADQLKTYAAAKEALKPMGFNFSNGGPNQGKLSAINAIIPGTDARAASQITLDVRLSQTDAGTEISALFTQVTEESFDGRPAVATSKPIDSTGIYETYFKNIDRVLAAPAK